MQLNISTDYAIRVMLFLVEKEEPVNAREISETMRIPLNTCKKNLQLLKNAGLVTGTAGIKGGYLLKKKPAQISIGDIGRAMGEKLAINRCLEPDCFCNREAVEDCPVRKVYSIAQNGLNAAWDTTLEQLMVCDDDN